MKKRTIITIAGSILVLIILRNIFWGEKAIVIEETARNPKVVQTQMVGFWDFSEQVHVTGRITPVRETIISTQGTGFIGSVWADLGDRVFAGQILATITDTYGLTGNSIEEAALGVTSANLSRDNSIVSLEQSLESSRIAFEKAKKDYEASRLSDGGTGTLSKAELDLQNYITTQEKTLSGYETTYLSQLQNFQSFLANVIDTSDTLVGVSLANRNKNDIFEPLLGAIDSSQKNTTETSIQKLLPYKNWKPDNNLPLIERVQEMQRVYLIVNEVLTNVETLLINTVTDFYRFTPADLAGYRATIDGYQTQYSSISGGLVTYLNTTQSFLATYEKERLSREQSVRTTAENSLNSLELAQKAYEAAQKARDIGASQSELSINSASLRLQNASWNAAKMSITAPFSGVIIARNAEIGTLASPGTNLFTLGDISQMIVKTSVSVEQQKYLRIGDEIPLYFGEKKFIGKLATLSAGPDPQNRLYKIEISLPSIHPIVDIGDVVDVVLPGAPKSADAENGQIVLPFSALKNLWQETYAVNVVIIDDTKKWTGVVRERIVKIGEMNETSVTIIEGLSFGEHIITVGTLGVDDGDYVQDPTLMPALDPFEETEKDAKTL